MTDESTVSVEQTATPDVQVTDPKFNEIRAAAQRLAQRAAEKRKESQSPAQISDHLKETQAVTRAAVETQESPRQEEDIAPAEMPPSDETEAVDPAAEEAPSIEPPRSWSREDKEAFKALAPEIQSRLVDLDRTRELEVRKAQNEAAERVKAYEADQQALIQARTQYEQMLPLVVEQLTQANAQFADIKTPADEARVSVEDPLRWVQYQQHKNEVNARLYEFQAAQQRQQQEQSLEWQKFAAEEDKRFAERYPEVLDPAKGENLKKGAVNVLKQVGFTEQELAGAWNGNNISLRDHRLQDLIVLATKYVEGDKKAKAAIAKSLPPVQKPGVAQSRGAELDPKIKALTSKPTLTMKEAAELHALRAKKRAS